ncbi:glycosyltransferase [Loigolactobacillus binensis]|uniref:Glycosyltransferase n=1 Tax=Loigolactobacillus binensis TaxID=2559922 RepID=A0ABW3EF71_9LACO|nr:glycosyltransferase [Loigolactobacillus binensis]
MRSEVEQNSLDLEVLIVDDGSTDNTNKIAISYQEKYSNIRVVTQQNQGVSQARNIGIKEACGEYLFYIAFAIKC